MNPENEGQLPDTPDKTDALGDTSFSNPDPGVADGAKKPLSPEEYAAEKKEIEEQGDKNESGHKNG